VAVAAAARHAWLCPAFGWGTCSRSWRSCGRSGSDGQPHSRSGSGSSRSRRQGHPHVQRPRALLTTAAVRMNPLIQMPATARGPCCATIAGSGRAGCSRCLRQTAACRCRWCGACLGRGWQRWRQHGARACRLAAAFALAASRGSSSYSGRGGRGGTRQMAGLASLSPVLAPALSHSASTVPPLPRFRPGTGSWVASPPQQCNRWQPWLRRSGSRRAAAAVGSASSRRGPSNHAAQVTRCSSQPAAALLSAVTPALLMLLGVT
jgi:hypothetical protein